MRYFSPETDPALYACPCGECNAKPTNRHLQMLDRARHEAKVAFIVSNGPRCHAYNEAIGGATYSEHLEGEGSDIISLTSRVRYRIIKAALEVGFTRIGIGDDFIHLGTSPNNDPEVIWTYYED